MRSLQQGGAGWEGLREFSVSREQRQRKRAPLVEDPCYRARSRAGPRMEYGVRTWGVSKTINCKQVSRG